MNIGGIKFGARAEMHRVESIVAADAVTSCGRIPRTVSRRGELQVSIACRLT
jgi:hypothetical protein